MDKVSFIYKQLGRTEKRCDSMWEMTEKYGDYWLNHYWFFLKRRTYLLGRLQKAQLKEFDREN